MRALHGRSMRVFTPWEWGVLIAKGQSAARSVHAVAAWTDRAAKHRIGIRVTAATASGAREQAAETIGSFLDQLAQPVLVEHRDLEALRLL